MIETTELAGIVRALAGCVQKWPLDMHADDAGHLVGDRLTNGIDCAGHVG